MNTLAVQTSHSINRFCSFYSKLGHVKKQTDASKSFNMYAIYKERITKINKKLVCLFHGIERDKFSDLPHYPKV